MNIYINSVLIITKNTLPASNKNVFHFVVITMLALFMNMI